MTSVASLALPFFGLIFLGFLCAKLVRFQEVELRMMNFFIVYVALPVLFFKPRAASCARRRSWAWSAPIPISAIWAPA